MVFTNGVFDLLHPGHIAVLEAARAQGGSLIVAVNSDASARALGKGPDRPVVDQVSRARVVAAIGAVDCVVLFDEPTPAAIIERIRPDMLVKGGDYTPETVAGGDFVRDSGGSVIIVPLEDGYSSTRILEQLRDQT